MSGRLMDLRLIGFAGHRRDQALTAAELELDAIADELIAAGDRANIVAAAKVAGVSRTTLYRRMALRRRQQENSR